MMFQHGQIERLRGPFRRNGLGLEKCRQTKSSDNPRTVEIILEMICVESKGVRLEKANTEQKQTERGGH